MQKVNKTMAAIVLALCSITAGVKASSSECTQQAPNNSCVNISSKSTCNSSFYYAQANDSSSAKYQCIWNSEYGTSMCNYLSGANQAPILCPSS